MKIEYKIDATLHLEIDDDFLKDISKEEIEKSINYAIKYSKQKLELTDLNSGMIMIDLILK